MKDSLETAFFFGGTDREEENACFLRHHDCAAECRPCLLSDLYGATLFQNGVNQDIKMHQEFFCKFTAARKIRGEAVPLRSE